MSTLEIIQQKVLHLPPEAQEEVLDAVEQIEERYHPENNSEAEHPLSLLAKIRIDGPPDLAERHDYYAHGKLED